MAFVLSEIISEIYNAYEALPGGRAPIGRDDLGNPRLGNLEWARNTDYPAIVWMLQSGTFNPAKIIGGENGEMYEANCRVLIKIWQVDLETLWTVMVDLLAAMRATVFGPNLGAQNFIAPTENEGRHEDHGEIFILDVTLSIPIPAVGSVPLTTVILETHTSLMTEDSNVLVSGAYVSFETVTVVGPIDEP